MIAALLTLFLVLPFNVPSAQAFNMTQTLQEWNIASLTALIGSQPHGITVDFQGMVWFTGKGSAAPSTTGGSPPALIGRLNPTTNSITVWKFPITLAGGTMLTNGTAENIVVDTSGQHPVVWFDIRYPTTPHLSRLGRLLPDTGQFDSWIPIDTALHSTCVGDPSTRVWIHGLDVARQGQTINAVWLLMETDNCAGLTGPIQVTGPAVSAPFGGVNTVTMTSYHPQNLGPAETEAGDAIQVDSTGTVWFVTDHAFLTRPQLVYQLTNAATCAPTCQYETWPIGASVILPDNSKGRPQGIAFAVLPTSVLWIEDRDTFTLNGKTGTLLERHNLPDKTIDLYVTPSPIPGTITNVDDESDIVTPTYAFVWFTEHGAPGRVTAFNNPLLKPSDKTTSINMTKVNATLTSFNVDSRPLTIDPVTFNAAFAQKTVSCNAPAGFELFSECPVNLPGLNNGGPNGLFYQNSGTCVSVQGPILWFTEQSVDKIGRFCLAFQTLAALTPLESLALATLTVAATGLAIRFRARIRTENPAYLHS